MTSIRLNDLVFDRGKAFRLGPISLEIESGRRTALVGPSGSGKTTLLRCVAGLERPASGSVRFDDAVMDDGSVHVAPNERGIGFVFQSAALWPHMTALEHLRFAGPRTSSADALVLLDQVGLKDKARVRPGRLSGGEGQRLALARALVGSPRVLLLDEPLRSVDVHRRDEIALLVRRLSAERNLTVVVVTHDRDEALAIADDVAVMHAGRVVEHGPADHLLTEPKTAYTATFLGRAASLPLASGSNGTLHGEFGDVARPPGEGPWSLVLLPGDVAVASDVDAPTPDAPEALVLRSERSPTGYSVHLELSGRTVRASADVPLAAGDRVRLRLTGAPRVLPSGHAEERER